LDPVVATMLVAFSKLLYSIIDAGGRGRRAVAPPKFEKKIFFGQTSCNIRAVDIFLEEGRTGTLYF